MGADISSQPRLPHCGVLHASCHDGGRLTLWSCKSIIKCFLLQVALVTKLCDSHRKVQCLRVSQGHHLYHIVLNLFLFSCFVFFSTSWRKWFALKGLLGLCGTHLHHCLVPCTLDAVANWVPLESNIVLLHRSEHCESALKMGSFFWELWMTIFSGPQMCPHIQVTSPSILVFLALGYRNDHVKIISVINLCLIWVTSWNTWC